MKVSQFVWRATAVAALVCAACVCAAAPAARLPAILGPHAVLQAGKPVNVWGFDARPGAAVAAELADAETGAVLAAATVEADAQGRFEAALPAMKHSRRPMTLTVSSPGADSGGGGGDQAFSVGGFGGAAVRIRAVDEVLVNGSILAHGGAGNTGAHDAGGAGGGIFIACRRFSGTSGVIAANGGTGRDNRSGGGGRIALWQNVPPDYDQFLTAHAEEQTMLDGFTGTVAVTAPASGIVPAAESGTIRYYTLNPRSVVIVVR